jgi:hypothetical protein
METPKFLGNGFLAFDLPGEARPARLTRLLHFYKRILAAFLTGAVAESASK